MEAVSSVPMAGQKTHAAGDGQSGSADWPRHLGDLIYAEMRKRGMTEDQVATHFGVAQSSISRWIKGTTRPRGQRVNQVAAFCGIDMALAFRLNYRMGEAESESAGAAAKIRALEERINEMGDDLRDVKVQLKVTNEALSSLVDVMREARDRTTKLTPRSKK